MQSLVFSMNTDSIIPQICNKMLKFSVCISSYSSFSALAIFGLSEMALQLNKYCKIISPQKAENISQIINSLTLRSKAWLKSKKD